MVSIGEGCVIDNKKKGRMRDEWGCYKNSRVLVEKRNLTKLHEARSLRPTQYLPPAKPGRVPGIYVPLC